MLRNQSSEQVSKEVAINLLEHLIALYIRVRIFSLVKDKRELHKMESKKKKDEITTYRNKRIFK